MVQAARQTRSEGCRLLGARGGARLGQHIHLPRGSFQPGGSEKELGCDAGRPRFSRVDQKELRTGQQTCGKSRRDVHASDGFFADEVVPDLPKLDLSRLKSLTPVLSPNLTLPD